VFGITPRTDLLIGFLLQEITRSLQVTIRIGEGTHIGAMVVLAALKHAIFEETIVSFRSAFVMLAPMSILCPLEDRFVFLFLGSVDPTSPARDELVPAFDDTPWLGPGFLFFFCLRLSLDGHSRHDLGSIRLLVRRATERNCRWLGILHG
jgi:hypothetical protein